MLHKVFLPCFFCAGNEKFFFVCVVDYMFAIIFLVIL